jgi:predicted Zn finger-like uncharacterized protein
MRARASKESVLIIRCLQCQTRYRVNELFFRQSAKKVRCSRCDRVFVVDRVSRISCSICGNETSRPEDYTIRGYKGSPYAICPLCAQTLKEVLEERT